MICFLWHPKWTKYTIWQAADKGQYRGNHMQKKGYYQYYVEGEDERKLLSVLKTEMECIVPGKIEVFNVVEEALGIQANTYLKHVTTTLALMEHLEELDVLVVHIVYVEVVRVM